MCTFGLIGKKLGHSFSKKYFTSKFDKEDIEGVRYELFELPSIQDFPKLLQQEPSIVGLNVTIPYKEEVISYLTEIDPLAQEVGAVNVIKLLGNGKLKGYNTDCLSFKRSLQPLLPKDTAIKALVLGTGGASKAVVIALKHLQIPFQLVSRTAQEGCISYRDLTVELIADTKLIINTTPLGMEPAVDEKPNIPYEGVGEDHILYDLIYNPDITRFMEAGLKREAKAKNGFEMLRLQAEASWEIWNEAQEPA